MTEPQRQPDDTAPKLAASPPGVRREIIALADEILRSDAPYELTIAIARRDAVLATASATGFLDVRELVALEAGGFDSRAAHRPAASAGAVAALQYLDALGIAAEDRTLFPPASLLDRMVRTLALTLAAHDSTRVAPPFVIIERTRSLVRLLSNVADAERARIDTLGKAAASSRRVHRALLRWPIASIERIIATTGLQVQAVTSALHRLRGLGIARELTRRQRHRVYTHDAWLTAVEADVLTWANTEDGEG